MRRLLMLLALIGLAMPGAAFAKKAKKKKKRRKAKQEVSIPIDIGIGPAVHMITGPIQDDQQLHSGLKLNLYAVISKKIIKANKHRIPKKYRGLASKLDEVRLRPFPLILLPDTLYLSPKRERTQMWGASWKLIGVGLPLIRKPVRLAIGVDLKLDYAWIDSDLEALGTTNFFRPGLAPGAELEIPFGQSFLISVGWMSTFYPPQEVGGDVFAWGELDQSIWHIGQAYLKLHFRIPYTTRI